MDGCFRDGSRRVVGGGRRSRVAAGRRARVELVWGALVMSPSPGIARQRASHRLARPAWGCGGTAWAPLEVLEAVNVVVLDGLLIPDIAVIDAAMSAEAGLTVHADDVFIVVEIASPSTGVSDRKMKPLIYAAAGIPHYSRLDLEPAPRLSLGHLQTYGTHWGQVVQAGETTCLPDPFPFDIDPACLVGR
ncbi:Uma2 family endonuclease [Streptomyces sp. NPDC056437]|uniref:Uma2 family endonuclease n=1 Tax=Streptomyces sp. NPDC056437 TaxID=3345816 RepID=UPI00368B5EBB